MTILICNYYLQLAAKLALESVRKEVEGSSRGAKIGQGVQHGGGKQATRGRGRGRRRGERVSKSSCVILGIKVCFVQELEQQGGAGSFQPFQPWAQPAEESDMEVLAIMV